VLVIVAPGQGAQTPGFLEPWLEDPAFESRLNWLSAVAGLDLAHYGTKADADTIRDTAIAQPLLVASSLLAALAVFPHPADAFTKVGAVAGHSVGEIAAAAGTGVLSAEQAMVLVRERGKAMAAAAALTATSMTAVLGGDREEILAKLSEHGLTAANDNGPGQIVAAGTVEELAALVGARSAGAVVTFAGVVRDHDHGRSVDALAYEGHPSAQSIIEEVAAGLTVRHPDVIAVAVTHRVGELKIGDVALACAVSAAHRRQAFEACADLVDDVKRRLPIWKHQTFTDGTDEWVNCP